MQFDEADFAHVGKLSPGLVGFIDAHAAFRNREFHQSLLDGVLESALVDLRSHGGMAAYLAQHRAFGKCRASDFLQRVRQFQIGEASTSLEGAAADRLDSQGSSEGSEAGASLEGIVTYALNGVGKSYLAQAAATGEYVVVDFLDESDNLNIGKDFIMPQLLDLDGYEDEDNTMQMVFQFPRKLQEIFWDYHEPYFDYAIVNKGIKGAIPIGEALELAGFDKVDNNLYRFNPQYSVKVDNNVIKTIIDSSKSKANGR